MNDNVLNDLDMELVVGGSDIDSLKAKGKEVPLPEAKNKKQVYDYTDGNYNECTYYINHVSNKLTCPNILICKINNCPGKN